MRRDMSKIRAPIPYVIGMIKAREAQAGRVLGFSQKTAVPATEATTPSRTKVQLQPGCGNPGGGLLK